MSNNKSVIVLNPQKMAYWTLILTGVMAVLIFARSLLIPITLAIFLSVLLNTLRVGISSLPWIGKYLNRTLISFLAVAVLFVGGYLLSELIASQSSAFYQYKPLYEARFDSLVDKLGNIVHFEPTALGTSSQFAGLLGWFGESLTLVFSNVILTLMFTLFLMAEQQVLPLKLSRLTGNEEKAQRIRIVCMDIANSIQTYITLKSVISAITGFATYLLLELVGAHFAPLWGLLIFFINFIPNLGSILGVALPSIQALLQFESLTPVLIVAVGLSAIQFIIGNIVEPAYMGNKLNLSPFIVLVALTFWGAVWGLVGMFLAIPLMVLVSLVCRHIEGLQWVSQMLSIDGKLSS